MNTRCDGLGTTHALVHGVSHVMPQHRRFRLMTRVVQAHTDSAPWRSENISEGGMFVSTAPPVAPIGTRFEVGFFLPRVRDEVLATVEVVWVNDRRRPDFRRRVPYGLGLRFVAISEAHRRLVRDYVRAGLESVQGARS